METQPTPEPRRLTRSSSDKVIGGVCAGIAKYLNVDVTVVRVVAVLLALVVGGLLGGARWLILPALALALPAGAVAAADVSVKGGAGERIYRPVDGADLRDHYRVGVGRLVLDLRGTRLSPGDHRVAMK